MSVRNLGMGWAYTAVANDESLLHANPAGIGVRRKLFQLQDNDSLFYFAPIQLGYSENLFGSLMRGEKVGEYFNLRDAGLSSSANISSPTDFVFAGNFWALSFISRGLYSISGSESYHQSKVFSQLKAGFKLYSFSLIWHQDFHIAMSAKVMYLIQSDKKLSNREINQKIPDPDLTDPVDRRAVATVYGESINYFEGFAFGIDFGLLWEIHLGDSGHQINLGIMVEDAPTFGLSVNLATGAMVDFFFPPICLSDPDNTADNTEEERCYNFSDSFDGADSTFFQVNGKFGIAYMFPDYWGGFFSDTMFTFDIHRIGDFYYNFVDMYHVGFSTTVFDMVDPRTGYSYRLNLSAGVSQNQFNAGYLVHLNVYQIGYNYFREKLIGIDKAAHRHSLTFSFYF